VAARSARAASGDADDRVSQQPFARRFRGRRRSLPGRDFITLLGGAAVVAWWPLAVRAQQPEFPARRLGLLLASSAEATKGSRLLEALTQGMKEYGWIEGQNITFEYRFGNADVLAKLAVELVQLRVDAI
jgi:putative ABC transport system substrate-binding protein